MSFLDRIFDRLLGRGDHAITVPPLDGAFLPNMALDAADVVQERDGVDDLALFDGRPVAAAGSQVIWLDGASPPLDFPARVTAIAGLADGKLVVALEDGQLLACAPDGAQSALHRGGIAGCITALCQMDDTTLCVAVGSAHVESHDWARDLMRLGRTGAVWTVALDGSAAPLRMASGLGWAGGVAMLGGRIVVSDSWNARLLSYAPDGGAPRVLLDQLPGYPGRMTSDGAGGLWLSVFAPRSQLVEFVLREPAYRARMIAEVPKDYWIAPCLRAGTSFLEPLQQGAVKQLGVLKPWSPSMSYGLLVRLNSEGRPLASLHSRADGARHGVTASLVENGALLFAAQGEGVLGRVSKEEIAA